MLQELYDAIVRQFFTPDVYDYAYIETSTFSLTAIILALFGGIIISAFASLLYKRVLGDFIRELISKDAYNKESAKTLSELGFLKNSYVRSNLKRGAILRKYVRCVEDDEYDERVKADRLSKSKDKAAEDVSSNDISSDDKKDLAREAKAQEQLNEQLMSRRTDLNNAHFYIIEEKKYQAEIRFDKKGTNWRSLILTVILCIVTASILIRLLPEILYVIDQILSSVFAADPLTGKR